MTTRNLTVAEAAAVWNETLHQLGVKPGQFPSWTQPFGAMLIRIAIRKFCEANHLSPPPEPKE